MRSEVLTLAAALACAQEPGPEDPVELLAPEGEEVGARVDTSDLSVMPDEVGEQAPVVWDWENVGTGAPVTVLVGQVANTGDEPIDLQVAFRADPGDSDEARGVLAELHLPPGESQPVRLDLGGLGFSRDQFVFSGQAQVYGLLIDPESGLRHDTSFAEPVYFHPRGDEFLVYDQEEFDRHRGDYSGRRRGIDDSEPGVTIDRYVFGGNPVVTESGTWDQARFWPWGADGPPDDQEVLDLEQSRIPDAQRPVDAPDGVVAEPHDPLATARTYRTCIHWDLMTTDSGFVTPSPSNVTEDKGKTSNDPAVTWLARGVRFKVSRPGFSKTIDTDTSGCATWTDDTTSIYTRYDLRVYGYARDTGGNSVRIHDGPENTTSNTGGNTYSILLEDINPTENGTDHHTVGSDDLKWTAMAVAGYSLYRYHDGVSNAEFHVAFDWSGDGSGNCNVSAWYSAPWNPGNDNPGEDDHFVKLGVCGSQPRRKFLVSHELGHAVAGEFANQRYANFDGYSPDANLPIPAGSPCTANGSSSSYRIYSYEYPRLAFFEGFAHFYSSKIYNNWEQEGAFTWGQPYGGGGGLRAYDLERALNAPSSGGHLENVCCSGSACDGAATIGDWLTQYWDWNTMATQGICTNDVPNKRDMMELQANIAVHLPAGADANIYSLSTLAVYDMYTYQNQIGSCAKGRWSSYADWNGVNN